MVRSRVDTEMEGLEKAVVDASVVVKWFNQEEFTEEALLLRQRIRRGTVTPLRRS